VHLTAIENFAEYIRHSESLVGKYKHRKRCKAESALLTTDAAINTKGYCFICGKESTFHTDFLYSDPNDFIGDKRVPNWRERVVCSGCKLNNRIRGSIHFLEKKLKARLHDKIYITEQTTPLYSYLQNRYSQLQGSEYLGARVPLGDIDSTTGIRNESITKLTSESDFFDFILSFDVFEHVPEYRLALAECLRCLKHGGTLLFTVPFNRFSEKNLVRAKVDENGDVVHILEPEFHGDPLNSEGCLCFYHFGWEMLEQMRLMGFSRVKAHLFWSEKFGYLGGEQILFSAQK
jgi:SAM-dependent methyltransferase